MASSKGEVIFSSVGFPVKRKNVLKFLALQYKKYLYTIYWLIRLTRAGNWGAVSKVDSSMSKEK